MVTNERRNREVRQHLVYMEQELGVNMSFVSKKTGINFPALSRFKAGQKNFMSGNLDKLENFYLTRYRFMGLMVAN